MSPGAKGVPASGSTQNFTNPVEYAVTSSDLSVTKVDTVTVTVREAPPVNDNFADAIELPGDSGTLSSNTNAEATKETGEHVCFYAVTTNTVWFKWTSTQAGLWMISTLGSRDIGGDEWDVVLAIYTGTTVSDAVQLVQQDTWEPETLSIRVTPGTYYLQAGGWGNANTPPDVAADIVLTWSFAVDTGPIAVGASGSGTLTFDAQPPGSEWSTLSLGGDSGTITDAAGIDTAMASIAASSIGTPLGMQVGSGTGIAYWRSDDQKLGTQPTGNAMTLLMATLQNTSGSTMDSLTVSYTLGATTNVDLENVLKGHRVYWSKTGAAGTWVPVGNYLLAAPGTRDVRFDLAALSWAAGGILYVVWADDNSSAGDDGDFTLDDVSFMPPAAAAVNWIGGDGNGDGKTNISDAVALLSFLYVDKTQTLACLNTMELNGDSKRDISDAVFLLTFLFVDSTTAPYGDPTYTTKCVKVEGCPIEEVCKQQRSS